MALSRYVLTATVTVPAGTAATPVAGEPETGGAAGQGSASISAGAVLWPQSLACLARCCMARFRPVQTKIIG